MPRPRQRGLSQPDDSNARRGRNTSSRELSPEQSSTETARGTNGNPMLQISAAELKAIQDRIQELERGSRPQPLVYKSPRYCIETLTEKATPTEVLDWCQAISDGNESCTANIPDRTKVQWALYYTEPSLQKLWRQHAVSMEDPSLNDLFSFVKRDHQFPEVQESQIRWDLRNLRQKDRTPDQLRGEWYSLQQRLGEPPSNEPNTAQAYDFFFRLDSELRAKLDEKGIKKEHYKEVCSEAGKQWALMEAAKRRENARRERGKARQDKKRPRDNRDNKEQHQHPPKSQSGKKGDSGRTGGSDLQPHPAKRPRTHSDRDRKPSGQPGPKKPHDNRCYICGEEGHFKKDCLHKNKVLVIPDPRDATDDDVDEFENSENDDTALGNN